MDITIHANKKMSKYFEFRYSNAQIFWMEITYILCCEIGL